MQWRFFETLIFNRYTFSSGTGSLLSYLANAVFQSELISLVMHAMEVFGNFYYLKDTLSPQVQGHSLVLWLMLYFGHNFLASFYMQWIFFWELIPLTLKQPGRGQFDLKLFVVFIIIIKRKLILCLFYVFCNIWMDTFDFISSKKNLILPGGGDWEGGVRLKLPKNIICYFW